MQHLLRIKEPLLHLAKNTGQLNKNLAGNNPDEVINYVTTNFASNLPTGIISTFPPVVA